MNSALSLNCPIRRQSPPPSPPLTASLHRHQNAPNRAQFLMPVTDLNLRRIATATLFQIRLNHHHKKLFSLRNDTVSIYTQTMADESKKTEIQSGSAAESTATLKVEDEKQREPDKPTTAIPPPPEKPLPGDCCGSGCVSCVWDLYYEELEEYNKLYKAN